MDNENIKQKITSLKKELTEVSDTIWEQIRDLQKQCKHDFSCHVSVGSGSDFPPVDFIYTCKNCGLVRNME